MARVRNNVLIEQLSGHINKQIVYKLYNGKTVVTKYPNMSRVKASKLQLEEKNKFREAVAYAKALIADPIKKAELQSLLPPGKTAYHQAIRNYLDMIKNK